MTFCSNSETMQVTFETERDSQVVFSSMARGVVENCRTLNSTGGTITKRYRLSSRAPFVRPPRRERSFLRPPHGRLGTQVATAVRCWVDRQLRQRIATQRGTVVRIFTSLPNGEHAETQHRRERMDHPLRVVPLPHTSREHLGQTEPAFHRTQQDQSGRPTKSTRS